MPPGAIAIGLIVIVALAVLAFGVTSAQRGSTISLSDRLGRYGATEEDAELPRDDKRRKPGRLAQAVDQAVAEKSFTGQTRVTLARADLRLTVGEWLIVRLSVVMFMFGFGFVLATVTNGRDLLSAAVFAVLGYFMPGWYLKYRIRRRVNKFINQLADAITLMANSLRAGYSLLQSMDLVSKETEPPMADEFRRVVHEVGLGIGSQEAMSHLLRRIPSDDLDLLVTAINIQHEVGGNLAQIFDVIGHTIRERVRIKGEITVLTAQQTISGYVVTALPIFLAVALFFISPDYIGKLFVFPWICMPIASGLMILAGFFIMKKITSIEV